MDYPAIREKIIALMGDFPAQCELEPKVISREDCGDYIREKIRFRSDAAEVVPAYLLIPKGLTKPAPAIVVNHSHGGDFSHGKSKVVGLLDDSKCTTGEMNTAVELVRRGYVCIVIDQKCFGERQDRQPDKGYSQYGGGVWYERFVFCEEILNGSTLQTRYVFDQSRAIDYLATRAEVDMTRIGTVGLSLGGQQSAFLTFYDPRVTVGISACGVAPVRSILEAGVLHNFALYLPGMLKVCDMDQMLATIAPRPLLIITGEQDDIFPIDGVREMGEFIGRRYGELRAAEKFKLVVHPGGHGFPEDTREIAWQWFDRFLGEG